MFLTHINEESICLQYIQNLLNAKSTYKCLMKSTYKENVVRPIGKKCYRSTEEKRGKGFSVLFTKEFAFVLVIKICVQKN